MPHRSRAPPEFDPMNRSLVLVRRWLWIALPAAALAIFGPWLLSRQAGAAKPAGAAANAPVLVTTAPVQVREMPVFQTGIGTVAAMQSVTVRARIDGQLERVAYTEGQDVVAGQLLVQLDPRTLQAQLAQARAQRAKDAAQLHSARADLERFTTLVAQDAATPQQLDNQRALVGQLSAAVQADDAQIAYAEVQLSYTRITAPISGRVGARLVDVGNIVHASDPGGLVVINQIDPIAVVFTLPEGGLPDVQRAIKASREPLAVLAFRRDSNEALGRGRLILVNNQIDVATGTVQLKASFANPQHLLWPGQYVNVRLVLGQTPNAIVVPAPAVQRSQAGSYAYVVQDDHRVRSQPIRVARIQDGLAVIAEGLSAGERVVVDGQYKLKPGAEVAESGGGASRPKKPS
jgi:multidrug efflux system membrane fusion protein